jgi:hypothetical protein
MERSLSISLKGFNDESLAHLVGNSLLSCFNELNQHIDISRLELISVGYSDEDYTSLLSEFRNGLDRTNDSIAVGAGMTVISNPTDLSFRIFFSGIGIIGLIKKHYDNDESLLASSIHTIVHEFMHVYVGTELYTNYPELLTTITPKNLHEELKWKTILSCWDEYRVCTLCATFGENPCGGYEEILKNALTNFDHNIARAKEDMSDWGILLKKVYAEIHGLLKYSSYYLGTCKGLEINYLDTNFYNENLSKSWFAPYFNHLEKALSAIDNSFDTEDHNIELLLEISKILVELSLYRGVLVQEEPDNSVWVQLLS